MMASGTSGTGPPLGSGVLNWGPFFFPQFPPYKVLGMGTILL